MTRVVVHIKKLVLHGFGRADAAMVSTGVQEQLLHQLAMSATPAAFAEVRDRYKIKADTVHLANDHAIGEDRENKPYFQRSVKYG